jgi:hypothetical protein
VRAYPHKARRKKFNKATHLAAHRCGPLRTATSPAPLCGWPCSDLRDARSFDPALVYTFDFFSAGPDFRSFSFKLLGKAHALEKNLVGQPVRFLAKQRTPGSPSRSGPNQRREAEGHTQTDRQMGTDR